MVSQGRSFDPILQHSGTPAAGALPGDAHLNDDQIEDLTQASNRSEGDAADPVDPDQGWNFGVAGSGA